MKPSPFLRPFVGALGFVLAYCIYLIRYEGRIAFDRVMVGFTLMLVSVAILGFIQSITKKRLDWIASIVGVICLTVLVGVIAVAVKTGKVLGQ